MKGIDILKLGFLAWLGYTISKEFGQPTNDANHNGYCGLPPTRPVGHNPMTWPVPWRVQIPQALEIPPIPQVSLLTHNNVANLDLTSIFEEAINKTFGKSTSVGLVPAQPKLYPAP